MSHSKENQHKKMKAHVDEGQQTDRDASQNNASKDKKHQEMKSARVDLNPQEDGDGNTCPDERTDEEPSSGSVCEFQ